MAKIMAFIILSLTLAGCGSSGNSTPGDESATYSRSYIITIGSGGGVTGNVTGIRIDTTGEVTAWSALPNQDFEPEDLGTMPADTRQKLYTIIEEDSLMEFHHAQTGNMTSYLKFETGNMIHRMRWSGIETDTLAAPPELRRFIHHLNRSYDTIEED